MKRTSSQILLMLLTLSLGAGAEDLVKKTAGRAPDPNLKIKQSGVPQFEIYQKRQVGGRTETVRVKNLPRLNVGEEPQLSAGSLSKMDLPAPKKVSNFEVKKLGSPAPIDLQSTLQMPVATVVGAKQLADPSHLTQIPNFNEPLPVADPTLMKVEPQQVEVQNPTATDLKLLQALIFLQIQKNYQMALGLFSELLDEAPKDRTEPTYHLALTSKALGLYSEYRHQMLKVLIDPNPDWQKRATLSLAESAAEGDLELVSLIEPFFLKYKLEIPDRADQYHLSRAKYYSNKGDIGTALSSVDSIMMDSPMYLDAQFLRAILLYKGGELKESIAALSAIVPALEAKTPAPELKTIAALTMARLQFQTGDYKGSFQSYLKVDKSHPEWPQAMIERAWAQILSGDYEGAAGNMFSLHTDFFKNTFAPESYVVRTVGYLNLCQYGDGTKVIQDMKRRYTPFQKKMESYRVAHPNQLDFYETVKKFMRDGTSKEIDGLPRSFIWALARHPSFILEQKNINTLEDQVNRYNRVTMDLINREKTLLKEVATLSAQLNSMKKHTRHGEVNPQLQDLEKRVLSYKIQHHIVKKARASIKDLRAQGLARLEKEKNVKKLAASKALADRFGVMTSNLTASLDQTDVLQYELYAGAGEHLRYQAAGGDIEAKENEQAKLEPEKKLKWEFKGEVWEDELGHYRSSLKNVCPETETNSTQEKITSLDQR